jgi:site-specific recombinase XerD
MLIADALEDYLQDCRIGLSAATVSVYAHNLYRLRDQLAGQQIGMVEAITSAHLRNYFAELGAARGHKPQAAAGYSTSTIHQHYRTVRTWLNWCVTQRLRSDNPLLAVRAPPARKPVARHISRAEMEQLLAATQSGKHPKRDYAIIILFLDTGIRRQELAELQPADVDLQGRRVTVRLGKMGRGRQVPISRAAVAALASWLAVRPAGLRSLFGLGGDNLYQMLQRARDRAGLSKASPHMLRHSFATYYDGDIYDLAKILGHKDIGVTAEIYAHREVERLTAVHDDRSPVAARQRAALRRGTENG